MKLVKTLITSSLLFAAAMASAQVQWLPMSENDLSATQLDRNARNLPASAHIESQAVNYAWSPERAAEGRPFRGGPTPAPSDRPQSSSRGYWVDVTGAELAAGVSLPISAPGAVIRISALENQSRVALSAAELQLAVNGRVVSAEFGASGSDLRGQGMPVPEATLAFQLGGDSAAGELTLRHGGVPADQALVVHVHEPNSAWVARLSLPRQNVLSGESLSFDLSLGDARQSLQPDSIQAVLISPDAGQSWPLAASRAGRLFLDAVPLASRSQPGAGLYEAHVYTEATVNGITIRRDLTMALNIAPAIARFNGSVSQGRSTGLNLILGVETLAPGRYQVNAEVFGTDAKGRLQPMAFVQSAAVLGTGRGQIQLDIDADLMRSSGLQAPYEVQNLMLLDQGRMYLLEQRQRALRIAR
jgi:hypothetical protein